MDNSRVYFMFMHLMRLLLLEIYKWKFYQLPLNRRAHAWKESSSQNSHKSIPQEFFIFFILNWDILDRIEFIIKWQNSSHFGNSWDKQDGKLQWIHFPNKSRPFKYIYIIVCDQNAVNGLLYKNTQFSPHLIHNYFLLVSSNSIVALTLWHRMEFAFICIFSHSFVEK